MPFAANFGSDGTTAAAVNRRTQLQRALPERILVIDGAMGTQIQALNLTAADFGGEAFEGCNDYLSITRPGAIHGIHENYLRAGADIIFTNTFGATGIVLADYPPLEQQAYEINRRGAAIARAAADAYSTAAKPRWVAGSMGPTTKAISVTGGVTFAELQAAYKEQARGLIDGGADYLLIETCQDTRNIKAALVGIQELLAETGDQVPIAVSGTIEPMGTMLAGQTVEALVTSLEHIDLLYFGLNCATGPGFMADHIRAAAAMCRAPIACVPNAGLPDENGRYLETPAMIARTLGRFMDAGWLNLAGGCCGTTPAHIAAIARIVPDRSPRRLPREERLFLSGLENLEIEDSARPILVGERTNVIGSRKFKRLIVEERFEEASEIARAQVKGGAHIIDVCLANPDRDELADVERFMTQVIQKIKVPIMIDSTDARVIERALTFCQGKAVINSINLEDGEERFDQVVPLARRYGAALIVGTIDEQGMAVSRERKLEIARRSYDLLVQRYGVPPTDIIFDPLTFPCATGDEQYVGSAPETIAGIRLIKQALPLTRTILGVSNVSFGLPAAGREVMNSVFLYHCVQAGLDLAIVNSEALERYASIPDAERQLAEDVLLRPGETTIAAFAAHFREAGPRTRSAASREQLPLDERLARCIVEGSKEGLLADLQRKLDEGTAPLATINGPLMAGMDEVGRLFNANQLIVAEVLQSAEVMKAAVAYLEPLMEKKDTATRGTIILATVKGDVHDIGKNLVHIILQNNGYRVINLGIKVPPQELIQAVQQHHPDLLGLSGLLVKSAQQMVVTAEELTAAGVDLPMLVGGAALTNNFTRKRIAPAYKGMVVYAKDAMNGLDLAGQLMDPRRRAQLSAALAQESVRLLATDAGGAMAAAAASTAAAAAVEADAQSRRSPAVQIVNRPPQPPDFERRVLRRARLDEVWAYLNPTMLYGKHLGLRGGRTEELLARGDEKAERLKEVIDALKAEGRSGLMEVSAVWQFFPAYSEGDCLHLLAPDASGRILQTFTFPRQEAGDRLCISDYANPAGAGWPAARFASAGSGGSGSAGPDNVCLFVVTAGRGVRERYEFYRESGEYLKSHAIQALALETAEAAAEWLHEKIRGWWGFPDDPGLTMKDRFQAKYQGKRFSFGYPACPDLALQRPLFDLLHPETIGVTLTDGFMMEPEASVSALVFHHPTAKYFSVGLEAN